MTFDHDFCYFFPLFSSLLKKRKRELIRKIVPFSPVQIMVLKLFFNKVDWNEIWLYTRARNWLQVHPERKGWPKMRNLNQKMRNLNKKMFKLDFENVKCKPRGIKYGKIHLCNFYSLSSRYFSIGSGDIHYTWGKQVKYLSKSPVLRSEKDPLFEIDQQLINLLFH